MASGSFSHFKTTLARKTERNQKRQARNDRNASNYNTSNSKTGYNFPKLSKSEIEKIKNEIRQKAKSERKKELMTIAFLFIILTLIILYFA